MPEPMPEPLPPKKRTLEELRAIQDFLNEFPNYSHANLRQASQKEYSALMEQASHKRVLATFIADNWSSPDVPSGIITKKNLVEHLANKIVEAGWKPS